MKKRDSEKLPAPVDSFSARDKRALVLFLFALLLIAVQFRPVSEVPEPQPLGIHRSTENNGWSLVVLSTDPQLNAASPLILGVGGVDIPGFDRNVLDAWPLDLLFFFNRPVPINHATAEHLLRLPGIGPHRAAAIVDDRERHGPFNRPEDLLRVSGIGPRTLEQLLPLVCFAP
ncbi:ComEA family DNA-binding protein [Desulfobulbus alkaliphilus]|uniref:ComEA family DNA-binding protein n=1 Tax=Desulfobulbus alkaliphilus TaxID=869814 RepID=UPI00196266E1|nr:ComEA family DNA-binding protein [Desulfobulbus alkaliphilus]MBM9537583.1 helix-hairpin-helix domain-containing protein [Desulfobulbus alkaliphilus]